jgi:hypothetical protein
MHMTSYLGRICSPSIFGDTSDNVYILQDVDGALLEATMAESLALAARPIVDVYSYIVESIVWPLATTSSDQLMAVQSCEEPLIITHRLVDRTCSPK